MKKIFTLLAFIFTITTFAQAPQGFNYQATVRNSSGALIVNQNVNFKFNIMLNSATSLPVFSETHMAPTDDLGQVNLVIGTGTATIGAFSTINWGTGNYYLGIELNTGAGYVAMGTTQLLSVPYALYANSSGNAQIPNLALVLATNNGANNLQIKNLANPTDAQDATTKQYVDSKIPNGTNVGDNLTWNGTNWVVTSANTTAQLPQLTTTTATGITPFAATSGGTITGDGGFSIISKGVAWSSSPNPTINDNFTNNGSGASTFQSILTNLLPGTSYYYRAYATNTVGTGYGMSYVLNTVGLPTVSTSDVIQTTSTTAVCGGTISDNGGANVTARGVCWSTNPNPTVDLNTKTIDGSGNGLFSSSITGLNPNTVYYIRAYATNSAGTAYGSQISLSQEQLVSLTIGNQIWSNANLDVTTYRDGTPIPQVTDPTAWANLTTGAWCYYSNTSVNGTTYGKLYNWYAVAGIHDAASLNDPLLRKQLAPQGWHIPTDSEWTTLTDFLGGETIAGGKMKSTGITLWQTPNTSATNLSGFNGFPGGVRQFTGAFGYINVNGYWWSLTETNTTDAWNRNLNYNSQIAFRNYVSKKEGFSVRCVRD
jgi:uncharacterized protein (TIGR02145 family)